MIDLTKYLIASEGFFSRLREKKAEQERITAERKVAIDRLEKEVEPKLKVELLNAQKIIYSFLKSAFANIPGVDIYCHQIDVDDFLNVKGGFCTVDHKYTNESDENAFCKKACEIEKKCEAVANDCGRKCCTIIKKIPGFENVSYHVDSNPDEYCATELYFIW